jgi:hypothetical protein
MPRGIPQHQLAPPLPCGVRNPECDLRGRVCFPPVVAVFAWERSGSTQRTHGELRDLAAAGSVRLSIPPGYHCAVALSIEGIPYIPGGRRSIINDQRLDGC